MQKNGRRGGPEVQNALAAKQQNEQTQDMASLQEQLDGLKKTLNQQKAAAQKLEQVKAAAACCHLSCHIVMTIRVQKNYLHRKCAYCHTEPVTKRCISYGSGRCLH